MPRKSYWVQPLSYVISVSLGTGCYRHIRISADMTFDDLSCAILDAFMFDNDHLHGFFMDNIFWSRNSAGRGDGGGKLRTTVNARKRNEI